ncbi:Fungal lipase-like domain [Dillenia turbinata]|uniref:Fungal lipase-like domain n=1 Tax=Dillenia turbinata TaxID=194707 RepID=A0AAN8V1A2_9MAGN
MDEIVCGETLCCDYRVICLDKVALSDLVLILFSRNIEKIGFVESPQGAEESFRHRFFIVVSVMVQKFLQAVKKPLKSIGSAFEYWLNLVSCNQNLGVLLLNILREKVIYPRDISSTFLSTIANLDPRLGLVRNSADSKYYGALSMMASKISYENEAYIEATVTNQWKMEYMRFGQDFWNVYLGRSSTQAFMLRDRNAGSDMYVVAFRGTELFNADDWCSDFDISWYELGDTGKIHAGFLKAIGLQKDCKLPLEIEENNERPVAYYFIRNMLRKLLRQNNQAKFILTGHSLGGALAVLFPAILMLHNEKWMLERLYGVYTFGQPRVGDDVFGEFMKERLNKYGIRYFRYVYGNDVVPRLPFYDSTLRFKHFGTGLYFNSCYKVKILEEDLDKNFILPQYWISMRLVALWELVRSFGMSYRLGVEYRETLFLVLVRIFGLLVPGIPAHTPPDYINASRLVPSHVFLRIQNNQGLKIE